MSFISYSLKYYHDALKEFESGVATAETIYKAQQLLKMLDDLIDESYTELYVKLEEAYFGVSRLKKYLRDNHTEPFKISIETVKEDTVSYEQEDLELTAAINSIIEKADNTCNKSDNDFLKELISFCKWIGYEKDVAYIFLLRDTMLPYIYYKSKNKTSVYPWLLGRKTLESLTGKKGTDDYIRAPIYNALELGECKNYDEFCSFVLPAIRKTLCNYPEIENSLTEMLNEINESRIIVVESGCYGTFPMLLMSLDNRVDMRMYTTVPYLTDIYADKIFTKEYEKTRIFETLYSQNLYFQFSNLNSKHFYVNKCKSKEIEERTIAEIKTILE